VSRSAIHAIEQNGGSVTAVYHTRRGIQQLLNPEQHPIQPPFEAPVNERDIEYYANPAWRGYLSNQEQFETKFATRGYLPSGSNVAEQTEPHQIEVCYQVDGTESILARLDKRRQHRESLYQASIEQDAHTQSTRDAAWRDQRWFPEQGNWKWINVVDGKVTFEARPVTEKTPVPAAPKKMRHRNQVAAPKKSSNARPALISAYA
jgi:hypothetical protein